jgi:uncharacterized membrane protein YjjP (DUF1212 family)
MPGTLPDPLSLTALYEAPPAPVDGVHDDDEDAIRFISMAARAFAAVDEIPARTEEGLEFLAHGLGFSADCTATATAILLSLTKEDHRWTEVIRVHTPGPDFTRAVALHRILERVVRGEITPRDGADRLTALLTWRRPDSVSLSMAASALLSFSVALLLGAQAIELTLVAVMGAMVGVVLHLIAGREHLAPLAPVGLAAIVSALAFAGDRFGLDDVRPVPTLLASLVILLPGWRLTVAMTELAQGHWTSGSGRFLAAVTTLLLLIVGVVVGQQVLDSPMQTRLVLPSTGPLPSWVRVVSPLLAGLAMTRLFGARRHDAAWIMLMCLVTSFAAWGAGVWLGSTAGAFVGAFTATAVGALLARRLRLPYPVLQQPAMVLLVPGAIGFLSLGSLVDRNVNNAVQTGFQMLFVALTLAIGALVAQVALRPVIAREYDDA